LIGIVRGNDTGRLGELIDGPEFQKAWPPDKKDPGGLLAQTVRQANTMGAGYANAIRTEVVRSFLKMQAPTQFGKL
jgi:hypothetical protein